jgi:hypothetical protein
MAVFIGVVLVSAQSEVVGVAKAVSIESRIYHVRLVYVTSVWYMIFTIGCNHITPAKAFYGDQLFLVTVDGLRHPVISSTPQYSFLISNFLSSGARNCRADLVAAGGSGVQNLL